MTVGKKRFSFGQVLLNVFFLLIVLTVAVPVINLAARSFASAKGALQMHGFSLWPSDPTLLNYQVVFSNRLILPSLWNNIVITVLGTAVNLLITLMAAYAVTRPRLVGKKFFMGFFIVMMLFNPGLMPEYLVVKQLKLIDSMWSVILVGAVNVYYLFILRRFIEEVPESPDRGGPHRRGQSSAHSVLHRDPAGQDRHRHHRHVLCRGSVERVLQGGAVSAFAG